jgi:hypothetical protein
MDDGCGHWKESGTEDADTLVDAQGCREEIKTGLKAIAHHRGRDTVKMRGHLVANNNQTS